MNNDGTSVVKSDANHPGMKVALVAIERPDGLLVERLLDAGLRLLALHPNQVAAARPRFRAAGGKSDRS